MLVEGHLEHTGSLHRKVLIVHGPGKITADILLCFLKALLEYRLSRDTYRFSLLPIVPS